MFKKHHIIMLMKYKDLGRLLSREEQKSIKGRVGEEAGRCLSCTTCDECTAVNKGPSCDYCSIHQKYCCSGWHDHTS